MADKTASIRLGIEGTNEVRNTLRTIKGDFEDLGKGIEKAGGVLKGIGQGFIRMGADAARAANDMKAIDFGAAADKFKALDDSITRMAIKGGRSISELRTKFAEFGMAAGVGPGRFAENVKQFDRMTFSGLDDAAQAMKSIGVAAEDADMSIEELGKLGEDLYQKLGVPASRIGEEFKRMKAMAADMNLPGGLGNMANIMSRLVQGGGNRVEGGTARLGAMVGQLREQGYSPEVATELAGKIIGMQNAAPQHLVRRTLRSITGDKNFEPYVRDPNTGRVQLSEKGQELLQTAYKRAPNPMGSLMGVFGNTPEGLEASQAYINMNWKRVHAAETLPARLKAGGAISMEDFGKTGGSAQMTAQDLYNRALGKTAPEGSEFSQTAAGERVRVDLEKGQVELGAGKAIQGARDRRNAAYKGHRTTQAAVDTVTGYMPGIVQDAIHLGEAASYSAPGQRGGAVNPTNESLDKAAAALIQLPGRLEKSVKAGMEAAQVKIRENPMGDAKAGARVN